MMKEKILFDFYSNFKQEIQEKTDQQKDSRKFDRQIHR